MSTELENQLANYGRWFQRNLENQLAQPPTDESFAPKRAKRLLLGSAAAVLALVVGLLTVGNRQDQAGSDSPISPTAASISTSNPSPAPVADPDAVVPTPSDVMVSTSEATAVGVEPLAGVTGCRDRRLGLDDTFPTTDLLSVHLTEFEDGYVAALLDSEGRLLLTACESNASSELFDRLAIGSIRVADDSTVALLLAFRGTIAPAVAATLPLPTVTTNEQSTTVHLYLLDTSWAPPEGASNEAQRLDTYVREARRDGTVTQTVLSL